MIVKIQRSVATNFDKPQVLIYNKNRTFLVQQDLDASLANIMGDSFKMFASIDVVGQTIKVRNVVPDQGW